MPVETKAIEMDEKRIILSPGAFVLGSTFEKVAIPLGYFGFIETKRNISRAGLSSHNSDGHIDPGFKGNITLEIRNNADVNITIYPGINFAQLSLWRIEGESTMYMVIIRIVKVPQHIDLTIRLLLFQEKKGMKR